MINLIPGKLYVRTHELRTILLYMLSDNVIVPDSILEANTPIIFTGTKIQRSKQTKSALLLTYYEFLYMTKIVYIMRIEPLVLLND